MDRNIFTIVFLTIVLTACTPEHVVLEDEHSPEDTPGLAKVVEIVTDEEPDPVPPRGSVMITGVPFIVQAPHRNWDDPIFQDGCEEASLIMAAGWLRGEKSISNNEAYDRIKELADYQERLFGFSRDTSAADTARLMIEYFEHEDVSVHYDITADDIIAELHKGNLVIVPADGRVLDNPYFTAPGPERHMLVIIGFNERTDEFITHDPGTRRGKEFRYKKQNLERAIRDYPSGDGVMLKDARTAMIVVHSLSAE